MIRFVALTVLILQLQVSLFSQIDSSNTEISKKEISDSEIIAKELAYKWNADSIRRSITIYLKDSEKWKKFKEYEKATDCLREIASSYFILGNNLESIRILNETRELDKNHSNIEKKIKTYSLYAISSLHLGKLNDALNFSDLTLKLSKKNNSLDSIATASYTKGLVEYENGKFRQATENFENALELWRNDQNISEQTKVLIDLAYAYMTNEEFLLGLGKAEESLKYAKETNNLRYVAFAQNAIGVLKSKLGRKQEALDIFLSAERVFPEGVDLLEKGDLYNRLAEAYLDFGELKVSEFYRLKALNAYEAENNPFAKILTLSKLGVTTFILGDEAKSLNYFDYGFKLANEIKSDFYVAVLNQDLGRLYAKKDRKKALNYLQIALNKFDKVKIKQHFVIVQSIIGSIYQEDNKIEIAKKYYYQSLKMSREIQNKFAESEILFKLAQIDSLEDKNESSIISITESIRSTESLYSDVANSNLKRSYFSNVYDRYELYIHLLMQKQKESPSENFAVQALQASEKSRSRSLLETLRLSEANFTKDANPELVQKEKELLNLLNLKATKLTELLSSNAEKSVIDKVDEERRTLENELETVKADLKQQSPIYSTIKNPPPFDVAEFQQNVLDDRTVLLEFSFGEKESYLWLIGKNEVSSYVLPAREVLENRIEKIRESFENRQMLPNEEIEKYQQRIADLDKISTEESKLLSNELIGQVVEKITDKSLIIVPDGKLALLPISALPSPNSSEPLITKNEVIYQPSASLLNILPKIQTNNRPPSKDLLVFADPVFDDTDNRLTAKNENQTSLPAILGLNLRDFRLTDANGKIPRLFATETEANSIAEVVGKTRTEIATGFAANREKVLDSTISDYRILHFATHGLVDVQRPEVSSIVLSQYDENGEKREGFLRLQDIYGLNLATDLVVLSACQSGIGKEIKGEGLMSLNNAFLQAGAKSVLSSAWKVDDDATAEFMKRFYANIVNKRLTASEALRQTQTEMINSTQFKSPFYWAAFTVQGEFRQPISVSTNYFYYVLFGVLVILGLGLLWRFRTIFFHK